ncbi:MAG: tandem-95 repeat protein [Proteobacteria bacterium]|nr:tandem-95 repeat protein [Pseudomonadota bacterium]
MTLNVKAAKDTATDPANATISIDVLANDYNNTRYALSVSSLDLTGTKGTATIDAVTGYVVYSPNGAFNYLSVGQSATDTLRYTVSNGRSGTSTALVTITVTGVNFAPVAGAVAAATTASASVSVNALASDSDPNLADTLSITGLDLTGTHGAATIDPVSGQVVYSPNGAFASLSAGQTATDTLRYTVSDNHGGSSVGVMTVTVAGVNAPPIAGAITAATDAGTGIAVDALAADSDPNLADTLSITALDLTGTLGAASIDPASGNVLYSPNGAFASLSVGQTATDTLHYTVSDDHGGSNVGVLTVTVSGVNAPPVAGAVAANTDPSTPISVDALAADSDPNAADTLTITALDLTGTLGTATIDPVTGAIDYSPNGAFDQLNDGETATDTLFYTVSDGQGGSSVGVLTVSIYAGNFPPSAANIAVATDAATGIAVDALAVASDPNPGDTLSIAALDLTGTKGAATIDPVTGAIDYSPNGAFDGLSAGQSATDTLHYIIADNHGGSSVGTMTVAILGVNVAPQAGAVTVATDTQTPLAVNALASDSDTNLADTLSIVALDLTGTKGTATIDPVTGLIDYAPNGAFNWLGVGQSATDTLQYTVSDGQGGSSVGTITVAIAGVNLAPVAGAVSADTYTYIALSVNALASDSDPNAGDTLHITALDLTGTKGAATIDPVTGYINYVPDGAFNHLRGGQTATDTLHYTVSDNHGASSVGTLTVTVTGPNAIMDFNPGYQSAALLRADGSVWMWGQNQRGQLGYGTVTSTAYSYTPTQVPLPLPMKMVGSGYQYSMAVSADGTGVYTWGDNKYGQLGIGKTVTNGYSVTPMLAKLSLPQGVTITDIADGGASILILRSDGVVMAWGHNVYGQCGLNPATAGSAILAPTVVPGLTGVTALAGGDDYTLALKSDGTVWAWGYDNYGQLGINGPTPSATAYSYAPVEIAGLPQIAMITSGGDDAQVLDTTGHVWQWGRNLYGELGNGTFDLNDGPHPTPTMDVGLSNIVSIDGQGPTAGAADAAGNIYAWGFGKQGQIGNGKTVNVATPTKVITIPTSPDQLGPSVKVAMSHYSVYAYNEVTGQVFGWGQNGYGQLTVPTTVLANPNPIDITSAVMGIAGAAPAQMSFMSGAAMATTMDDATGLSPLMADTFSSSLSGDLPSIASFAPAQSWASAAWWGADPLASAALHTFLTATDRPVYG